MTLRRFRQWYTAPISDAEVKSTVEYAVLVALAVAIWLVLTRWSDHG